MIAIVFLQIKSWGFVSGRSCRDRSRDRTGRHMSVCKGLDGETGWGTNIRVLFRYVFFILVVSSALWGTGKPGLSLGFRLVILTSCAASTLRLLCALTWDLRIPS